MYDFLANFLAKTADIFRSPTSYLYLGHLIPYLVIIAAYLVVTKGSLKPWANKNMWWTSSLRFDYVFVATVFLGEIFLILAFPLLTGHSFFSFTEKFVTENMVSFVKNFAPITVQTNGGKAEGGVLASFIYSLGLLFFTDGAFYLWHRIGHHQAFLWNLHKVHHSATELNFVTSLRNHPVYNMGRTLFRGTVGGTYVALVYIILGYTPTMFTVMNIGILHILLTLIVYLSHTPYFISFGPLDRIFVSPAMHQLHHSIDPKHHDCNYAIWFSLWDWIGGTLILPEKGAELKFGITPDQWGSRRYDNVLGSLIDPLLPERFLKKDSHASEKPKQNSAA